jgi:hypothetical protein
VQEEPKVKLKIRIPGALTDAAAASGESSDPSVPPPFPVVLAPGAEGARPGVPKPGVAGRRIPAAVLAKSARKKKIAKLILVGLGGVALAAGMIKIAMVKFIDPPPPPPSFVPKPRPPVKLKPVEEAPVVAEPEVKIPVEQVDRPVTRTPKPRVKSGETTTKATTDLAPGVTVTTEAVHAEIEASQGFRTFVADAKISGVFQGTPSRAFINGRLVRAGETVDASLGVRFDSVDTATKNIVFKDANGAKVSRRY